MSDSGAVRGPWTPEAERLWRQVVGADSGDDDDEDDPADTLPGPGSSSGPDSCGSTDALSAHALAQGPLSPAGAPAAGRWEAAPFAQGLWLYRGLLSPQQQASALHSIQQERWFHPPQQNQHMRFGELPALAQQLSTLVLHAASSLADSIQGSTNASPPASCAHPASCWEEATAEGRTCVRHGTAARAQTGGEGPRGSAVGEGEAQPVALRKVLAREPLFDQMIANWYSPVDGIKPHVDLLRFDDGIAVVSLQSSCVMSFARAPAPGAAPAAGRDVLEACTGVGAQQFALQDAHPARAPGAEGLGVCGEPAVSHKVTAARSLSDADSRVTEGAAGQALPVSGASKAQGQRQGQPLPSFGVLLSPGDLLLLFGEARYQWTHGILRDPEHQVFQGQRVAQEERVSITLRRLLPDGL